MVIDRQKTDLVSPHIFPRVIQEYFDSGPNWGSNKKQEIIK